MRYIAKPDLKDRLIQLNGGAHGYLHKLRASMARNHRESQLPSINFLWQIINADKTHKATPPWQVVEIIRYVERDPKLDYVKAFDKAGAWFDVQIPAPHEKGVKTDA